jgi:hypothetical protein
MSLCDVSLAYVCIGILIRAVRLAEIPADGMNQQGTTFFYCIPAQL